MQEDNAGIAAAAAVKAVSFKNVRLLSMVKRPFVLEVADTHPNHVIITDFLKSILSRTPYNIHRPNHLKTSNGRPLKGQHVCLFFIRFRIIIRFFLSVSNI